MIDVQGLKPNAGIEGQERPLATFALFAYNQEAFVREAVSAALAQTYRPLEIILSDDASTDRTFQIMEDVAKACPAGVRLILNRNERNLGIGNHINKVVGMSSGEILVLAAGDDMSLPHRTAVSVDALQADDQKRQALHGTVINVDAPGRVLYERWNPHRDILDSPEAVLRNDVYLTGSSVAVRRSMYVDFPMLNANVVNEDKVTAFRCAFFGGAIYIDQPVTKYRAGVGVSTLKGAVLSGREDPIRELTYMQTTMQRRLWVLEQIRVDCANEPIKQRMDGRLLDVLEHEIQMAERVLRFMERPGVFGALGLFAGVGLNRKMLKLATLLLFPSLYHFYKVQKRGRVAV